VCAKGTVPLAHFFALKVPAIPSLVAGALLGGLIQIIVQGQGAVATALYMVLLSIPAGIG